MPGLKALCSSGTNRTGRMIPPGVHYGWFMELPEETVADLVRRLRRIEGQVRGIQQMLTEGRDCREIVTQLAAANKALEQTGFTLIASGLTWCLQNPEQSVAAGYEISDVQKMFTKIA
jgi:DNA-binding FrmR family transcriptional regulator